MIDFELSAGTKMTKKLIHQFVNSSFRPLSREYDEEEHKDPSDLIHSIHELMKGGGMSGMGSMAGGMIKSALSAGGGSLRERMAGVLDITAMLGRSRQDRRLASMDPVLQARQKLTAEPSGEARLEHVESEVREEIFSVVRDAVEVRP